MALELLVFEDSNLSISNACCILNEYARGILTSTELKMKFLEITGGELSPAMGTDVDNIITKIDAETTVADKSVVVQEIRDVFVLSQSSNANMYQTAEEIRERLGFVE